MGPSRKVSRMDETSETQMGWRKLLSGLPRLLFALLGVAFVIGILVAWAMVMYAVATQAPINWDVSTWELSDWMGLGVVGFFFSVLGRLFLIWLWEAFGMLRSSAEPVAESVDVIRQERDQRRERAELAERQGGALSVSQDVDGGELTQVVFEDGALTESQSAPHEVSSSS